MTTKCHVGSWMGSWTEKAQQVKTKEVCIKQGRS